MVVELESKCGELLLIAVFIVSSSVYLLVNIVSCNSEGLISIQITHITTLGVELGYAMMSGQIHTAWVLSRPIKCAVQICPALRALFDYSKSRITLDLPETTVS